MAANLINLLQHEFSDDVISKLGSVLGESEVKTRSALGYGIPAVVGALFHKAQTPEGAEDVASTLRRGGFDGSRTFGSLTSQLASGAGPSDLMKAGGSLVGWLFGSRQDSLTEAMASTSGIGKQASGSLLALAAAYIARVVGREAASSPGGFNVGSLTQLLSSQGPYLASVAPAGLSQLLGISSWTEPARAYTQPRAYAEPARAYTEPAPARAYEAPRQGGLGWLKWALPLLLVPLLIWGWRASRSEVPARANLRTDAPPSTPSAPAAAPLAERTLSSCGQQIRAAENGVEVKLIDFIEDRSRPIDKETWFTFDRLEFETASDALRPASTPQIRNIAAIMKCYPAVALKVGGYTDNTGDDAANLRLSQSRADSTVRAIAAEGIAPARLEAEGYGEQFPVATNETEEGRQRNRRIDVRVTKR